MRGMAIHLGRPLPGASRDRPGRRRGNPPAGPRRAGSTCGRGRRAVPTWSCSRWGLPCRPRRRGRGALLPHPFTLTGGPSPRGAGTGPAVCFLWHFPWGRPRRALPGTVFPWSPDFPPPARRVSPAPRKAAIRPSGTTHKVAAPAAPSRTGLPAKPEQGLGEARRLARSFTIIHEVRTQKINWYAAPSEGIAGIPSVRVGCILDSWSEFAGQSSGNKLPIIEVKCRQVRVCWKLLEITFIFCSRRNGDPFTS